MLDDGSGMGLIDDFATVISRSASILNPFASEKSKTITSGDISSARRIVPFGRHIGVKDDLDLWLIPKLKM
jgi:hypothetical protein